MNKEWYSFDVREEVLKDFVHLCNEQRINLPVDIDLTAISTSTLMDMDFLASFLDVPTANSLKAYIEERFFFYRGKKYGNRWYWQAAKAERDIGYNGHWESFIMDLLKQYISDGDKVLFVGTANGSEIPQDGNHIYYALEQLAASANQIKTASNNIQKTIIGSFEDTELVVDHHHSLSSIVALRCLTPNCRLDRFAVFVQNNMVENGTLIISYPTSYLNETGVLVPLPNINTQLQIFEQKISTELVQKLGLSIVAHKCTQVEKILILARTSQQTYT